MSDFKVKEFKSDYRPIARKLYLTSVGYPSWRFIAQQLHKLGYTVNHSTISMWAKEEDWKATKEQLIKTNKIQELSSLDLGSVRSIHHLERCEYYLLDEIKGAKVTHNIPQMAGLIRPYLEVRKQRIQEEREAGIYETDVLNATVEEIAKEHGVEVEESKENEK